jgi:capsular polysaccharide export protein
LILAFGVNKKQVNLFEKIKEKTNLDIKIIYSKKIFSFSLKSLKYLKKVNFRDAVELRVKDFYAKYNFYLPEFIVRNFYNLNALFCFMRYFSIVKPEYKKILIWNGFMFRQAIILEIAKLYGIEPVYFESGFLPNRFVIDKKGVNFYNSVPRDKKFYENYHNDKSLPDTLIPRKPKNAKKFSSLKKEPLPENFIFVPFQVDYDTQILLFSPWVRSMEELFFLMKEIAEELKINIVFKEHPSSRKEYPHLHKIARQHKFIQFANAYPTQELIQKANAVVTINSSVGIESLLFYKKVITLGEAFYNIDGIVKHVQNKEELEKVLKNLNNFKIDKNLIKNFLTYLYYDYLIPSDFSDVKKIKERIIK